MTTFNGLETSALGYRGVQSMSHLTKRFIFSGHISSIISEIETDSWFILVTIHQSIGLNLFTFQVLFVRNSLFSFKC